MRRAICLMLVLAAALRCEKLVATDPPDYLNEPFEPAILNSCHGLEKKLLVPSAQLGQIVEIPSFHGELAVSVYRAPDGSFHIASAEAQSSLCEAERDAAEHIAIQRKDAVIDAEFAAAIQRALRAVLSHEPIPKPDYEPNTQLDGSIYLFRVGMPDGAMRGRATGEFGRAPASELIRLTEDIFSYCQLPPERQPEARRALVQHLTSFAEHWEKA